MPKYACPNSTRQVAIQWSNFSLLVSRFQILKKSARRASNIQEDAYKGARPRLKACYPEEKQNILVSKQDSWCIRCKLLFDHEKNNSSSSARRNLFPAVLARTPGKKLLHNLCISSVFALVFFWTSCWLIPSCVRCTSRLCGSHQSLHFKLFWKPYLSKYSPSRIEGCTFETCPSTCRSVA